MKQNSKKKSICCKTPTCHNTRLLSSTAGDFRVKALREADFYISLLTDKQRSLTQNTWCEPPLHTHPSMHLFQEAEANSTFTAWTHMCEKDPDSKSSGWSSSGVRVVSVSMSQERVWAQQRGTICLHANSSSSQLLARLNPLANGLTALPRRWVNPSLDLYSEPNYNLFQSKQLQRLLHACNNSDNS